jgi:hypothetical protein
MSVHRVLRPDGSVSWQVRWRDGGRGSRARKRTFDRRADAVAFEDEIRRRRRLGDLVGFAGAQETLNRYVTETWAKTYAVTLAPKTAKHYASLYDLHIEPYLGELKLTELTPEVVSRWQAERLTAGAGRVAVLHALDLLGSMLQRAVEGGRLGRNPVRLVRKIARPRRREVKPLAPATVEAMRATAKPRDAALIAVLAYAGPAAAGGAGIAVGRCARADAVDSACRVARPGSGYQDAGAPDRAPAGAIARGLAWVADAVGPAARRRARVSGA